MKGSVYAVLQSSSDPISMEQLTDEFIGSFVINDLQPTEVVEVETISSALCVFKNYGGPSHSYFCALPKRKWGRYFGQKITRYYLISDAIHKKMIDDKPNPSSLPLLWSWGAGGVSRPPDPRRPPMAKMSLILFMFFLFSGGQVALARGGLCRASCCWSSYSLIAELYVAGFLPSFGYPSTPPGLLHSRLVSVI